MSATVPTGQVTTPDVLAGKILVGWLAVDRPFRAAR